MRKSVGEGYSAGVRDLRLRLLGRAAVALDVVDRAMLDGPLSAPSIKEIQAAATVLRAVASLPAENPLPTLPPGDRRMGGDPKEDTLLSVIQKAAHEGNWEAAAWLLDALRRE